MMEIGHGKKYYNYISKDSDILFDIESESCIVSESVYDDISQKSRYVLILLNCVFVNLLILKKIPLLFVL